MASAELKAALLAAPSGRLGGPETPRHASEPAVREDLDLCFVCLRWASADTRCLSGMRCDYQRLLDRLESC
jgi:hypothetical protein